MHQYKPLSSPRSNQQIVAGAEDANALYQQQLAKKDENIFNKNFSPVIKTTTGGLQSQLDYQRGKQMSSGSEKRLNLHQQRQYYSEQFRVAQQQTRQQQTANAVLKQTGSSISQTQNPSDLRSNELNSSSLQSQTKSMTVQSGRDSKAA